MSQYLPIFKPGQAITLRASASITGGQVVSVSGNGTVAPAGNNSPSVVGVAGFDAAENDNVTIFTGGVQHVAVDGGISSGAQVVSSSGGQVEAADEDPNVIGIALTGGPGGTQIRVLFNR